MSGLVNMDGIPLDINDYTKSSRIDNLGSLSFNTNNNEIEEEDILQIIASNKPTHIQNNIEDNNVQDQIQITPIVQTPVIPSIQPPKIKQENIISNQPSSIVEDKYNIDVNNVEDWNEEELQEEPKKHKTKEEKKKAEIEFDLDLMNRNFDKIRDNIQDRLKTLDDKQKLLNTKIETLQRFISVDEKDLALEYVKAKEAEKEKNNNAKINYNLISTIQAKISNKLELLNNTFDIYLKLEDIILKWTKELFNIEKEKLSSFTKIKNLNKNTETTEDDIMNIIDKINSDIKANPNMIHDAKESLRIEGYDGKRFNEEKE